MIANFFNKTKPVNLFILVLLLFVYYIISISLQITGEFSAILFLKKLTFFGFYFLFLLILKFIIEKNKLTQDNSYVLFLVVMFLGIFSETIFSNYIVFSNIFLLLSFRKIYSLKSGIKTKIKLFDAAFWIGISTLIYFWSIFYLLLIYIGILIYQKGNFKNFLIPILGFITPIFLYFTYNFYYDNLAFFYSRFNYGIDLDFDSYNSLKLLLPLLFLIPILLWSIITTTPKIVLISNNLKLSWNVLLGHLFLSSIIITLSPLKNGSELFYIIFPSTIIITNSIQKIESSIIKNILLYLFLILSVVMYFLQFFTKS